MRQTGQDPPILAQDVDRMRQEPAFAALEAERERQSRRDTEEHFIPPPVSLCSASCAGYPLSQGGMAPIFFVISLSSAYRRAM